MSFQDIKLEVDAPATLKSFLDSSEAKEGYYSRTDMAFEGYSKVTRAHRGTIPVQTGGELLGLADSIVGLDAALGSLSLGVERLFEGSVVAIREVESVADMAYGSQWAWKTPVAPVLMGDSEYAHPTL
jgi:hypothetical protein